MKNIYFIIFIFLGFYSWAQIQVPTPFIDDIHQPIAIETSCTDFLSSGSEVLDSSYCYKYDTIANEWQAIERSYFTYDSGSHPIEELVWSWAESSGNWIGKSRVLRTYNELGQLTEEKTQKWDTSIADWIDDNRILYSYYENGLELDAIHQISENNEWKNASRRYATYHGEGIPIEEFIQFWSASGQWETFYRYHFIYTYPSFLLVVKEGMHYVDLWQYWEGYQINIYTYDEEGRQISDTLKRYSEFFGYGGYNNYKLTLTEYDDQGNKIGQQFQLWRGDSIQWVDLAKIGYTYDTENQLTEEVLQNWQATAHELTYGFQNLLKYDLNGNVTEDLYQEYDDEKDEWINYWLYLMTYDANSNQTSYIRQEWNDSTDNWFIVEESYNVFDTDGNQIESSRINWMYEYGSKQINSYSPTGKPATRIDQNWDFTANEWVNNSQNFYTYNDLDSIGEELGQVWDLETEEWINSFLTMYSYNEVNLISERLSQQWEQDQWQNKNRTLYSYNQNKQETETVYQNWSDNGWVNSGRNSYVYDESGNRIEDLYQKWESDMWDNHRLNTWAYNSFGNLILGRWYSWQSGQWELRDEYINNFDENGNLISNLHWPYYGTHFAYDSDGNVTEEIYVNWSELLNQWVNDDKYIYKYDENGNIIEEEYYQWNDILFIWELQWINKLEILEYSNDQPLKYLLQYWNATTQSWSEGFFEYEYDLSGNPTLFLSSYLAPTEYDWVNATKCDYFWGEIMPTSIEEIEEQQLNCDYPNPFGAGINSISCDQLEIGKEYELEVYNLLGELLYSEVFQGNSSLGIDKILPFGSYALIIRDEEKILHRNKLIIY